MSRLAGCDLVARVATVAVILLFTGCTASDHSNAEPATDEQAFASLPLVTTVDLANAPRVVLATATGFRDVCMENGADHLLAVKKPSDTGDASRSDGWLEYAFVANGVFYVLPAEGYRCPADRLEAEARGIPDSRVYYELKRRGFPYARNRSYFVE